MIFKVFIPDSMIGSLSYYWSYSGDVISVSILTTSNYRSSWHDIYSQNGRVGLFSSILSTRYAIYHNAL